MSFYSKYRSRTVEFDPMNPKALITCDLTQSIFAQEDTVMQKDWRGNSLVQTGFRVGKMFADEPNPQNRPPPVVNDPTVPKNPRLYPGYQGLTNVLLTYDQILAQLDSVPQGQPAPGTPPLGPF